MTSKTIHKDGKANITVYANGEIFTADDTHPAWNDILAAVQEGDESANWAEIFSLRAAITARFEKLSERVAVAGESIYFDAEPVDDSLATQTLKVYREGGDFQGLVNFMENIAANPEPHSREQLFDWLRNHNFTITPEGNIVGYKGVKSDGEGGFQSTTAGRAYVNGELHVGQIPNAIGDEVEMPRGDVDHDPHSACSSGLHVGTHSYAQRYGYNGAVLEVHVNPRDVVSVPTDGRGAKIRVCRYRVVDLNKEEIQQAMTEKTAPVQDNMVTPGKPRFEELAATAKKQKKGFQKVAEKKGWVLVGADPTNRKDWRAPRAPKRKGK